MLQSFLSKVPAHWDAQFILARLADAGVINHFGYSSDAETSELCFRVLNDDADALLAIIDGYQVDYLPVLLPKLKEQVVSVRTARRLSFTFSGMAIPLDEIAMSRLTGMASGLQLCPEVEVVDWDVGVLDFVSLPRTFALALAAAAFKFVQGDFTYSKVLGAQLDAAATADEALAIDLLTGWPAQPEA